MLSRLQGHTPSFLYTTSSWSAIPRLVLSSRYGGSAAHLLSIRGDSLPVNPDALSPTQRHLLEFQQRAHDTSTSKYVIPLSNQQGASFFQLNASILSSSQFPLPVVPSSRSFIYRVFHHGSSCMLISRTFCTKPPPKAREYVNQAGMRMQAWAHKRIRASHLFLEKRASASRQFFEKQLSGNKERVYDRESSRLRALFYAEKHRLSLMNEGIKNRREQLQLLKNRVKERSSRFKEQSKKVGTLSSLEVVDSLPYHKRWHLIRQ